MSGSLNGSATNYVKSTSYAAHGGITGWSADDNVTRSVGYNARLQQNSVVFGSLMTLGLNWGTSVQNNGNLTSQNIGRPGLNASQSYGYDGVNRLTSASEGTTWNQSYIYDNVGNRALTTGSSAIVGNYTPTTSLTSPPPPGSSVNWPYNPPTNQLASTATYDAAGNVTAAGTQTMVYDAESRMTSWTNPGVGNVSLTYDGDGRRVSKTSGVAGTTYYVYDPAGNLAVESGGAAAPAATSYLTTDHLGSVRLVTDGSGNCLGAHDYLPFWEEIPQSWGRSGVGCYAGTDNQSDADWKFGGEQRDEESGIDNFLARMMMASMGRFLGTIWQRASQYGSPGPRVSLPGESVGTEGSRH